jgi:hypothetical protein
MWPAIAFLSLFVVLVIMLILRYGSKWLNLRHITFSDQPTQKQWEEKGYAQPVSYA